MQRAGSTVVLLLALCLVSGIYIDPRTPQPTKVRQKDGRVLGLVMSDEFDQSGRRFGPGQDNIFEALDRPDSKKNALDFYNSSTDYITTREGSLVMTTKPWKTHWYQWDTDALAPLRFTKNYTSAMVQTWNKFCFTGGVLELSIQLPGSINSGGVWPAAWLMGNLVRGGYPESTTNVWPWSYNSCDGLEGSQEISACNSNPEYGLNNNQGRGAPEIDIFEATSGPTASVSSGLQVAPGLAAAAQRPGDGSPLHASHTWYPDLALGAGSTLHSDLWGQECGPISSPHECIQDAISATTAINASFFETYHNYKIEWQPGANGYLYWYLDDVLVFGIESRSLAPTGALMPEEPMYLILSMAVGARRLGTAQSCLASQCDLCDGCFDCANPACQCALPDGLKGCRDLPAQMKVDFIRLYQDVSDPLHTLSCSPRSHPTAEFIAGHPDRYAAWAPMSEKVVMAYFIAFNVGWVVATVTAICVFVLCLARCDNCLRRLVQRDKRREYIEIV